MKTAPAGLACLLAAMCLAIVACSAQVSGPVGSASPPATPANDGREQVEAACRSQELALSTGDRIPEPTGQHSLALTLTNRSPRPCVLFGYPTVSLLDATGQALPFEYRQRGDQVVTSRPPARVELSPGSTAYVTINKYRCDLATRGTTSTVELVPPGETDPLQVALPASAIALGYCGPGDPGSIVSISPIGTTLRDTLAH